VVIFLIKPKNTPCQTLKDGGKHMEDKKIICFDAVDLFEGTITIEEIIKKCKKVSAKFVTFTNHDLFKRNDATALRLTKELADKLGDSDILVKFGRAKMEGLATNIKTEDINIYKASFKRHNN
jgi:hypothetical protein